jgi:hypothetical protein
MTSLASDTHKRHAEGVNRQLMADDEAQIRSLIERWAEAVHGGDIQHEHHSFPDTSTDK